MILKGWKMYLPSEAVIFDMSWGVVEHAVLDVVFHNSCTILDMSGNLYHSNHETTPNSRGLVDTDLLHPDLLRTWDGMVGAWRRKYLERKENLLLEVC